MALSVTLTCRHCGVAQKTFAHQVLSWACWRCIYLRTSGQAPPFKQTANSSSITRSSEPFAVEPGVGVLKDGGGAGLRVHDGVEGGI
jgi:hypothetical protein